MKRLLALLIGAIVFSAGCVTYALHAQYPQGDANQTALIATAVPTAAASATSAVLANVPAVSPVATSAPTATPLPATAQLDVPYTLQAPFNVWDALHENACEETSLIMVYHYLNGTPISSPTQADQEITALVNWETAKGYGPSITLAQLNQIAKDYYGLDGQVVVITSIDQVKQVIAAGHPVILGMAGKLLPNPYFSNGGPNYHMLVAKGYDATGIITNDPGTWHGNGFHYDYDAFYTAIHDWDATNILNGQKAYLVFK